MRKDSSTDKKLVGKSSKTVTSSREIAFYSISDLAGAEAAVDLLKNRR